MIIGIRKVYRAKLFDIDRKEMHDVTPLFSNEDFRVFGRAADPDPYEDEAYQKSFRLICDAISRGLAISVTYKSQTGEVLEVRVVPKFLEYSDKDDKFRVITIDGEMQRTINLGRILSCEYCSGQIVKDYSAEVGQEKRICGLELTDVNKALERAAIHFSHYRKTRIIRTGENRYYLEFEYDADLESELAHLVTELKNGNKSAFNEIYMLSAGPLERYGAIRLTNDQFMLQDALQDTFVSILEKIDQLKEPASFMAWAFTILRNKISSEYRKTK